MNDEDAERVVDILGRVLGFLTEDNMRKYRGPEALTFAKAAADEELESALLLMVRERFGR
jgi:hypothetical protein